MENGAEECNAIVNMAPATTTTIASPACSGRCLSNNSSGRGFSSLSRMGSGKKSCPDYDYLDSVMSMRSTRIHSSRSFHSASIVLASDEEAAHYFRQAAAAGLPSAQYRLALLYEAGRGVHRGGVRGGVGRGGLGRSVALDGQIVLDPEELVERFREGLVRKSPKPSAA